MTSTDIALVWLREHWSLAWPFVSAFLILVLRSRTPEEWVALGERSPRAQGAIRLLRGVGLDPAKALAGFVQMVTGRAPAKSIAVADAVARTLAPTATETPAAPETPTESTSPAPEASQAPVAAPEEGTAPRSGESGHARVGVLAALVMLPLLGFAGLSGCPPIPRPEPGPSQPVSGWTSTARAVLSTLRWALPAVRSVTDMILSDPPRAQVGRALDAAADAAGRLSVALDAYEARGGDSCVAHAAAGGVVVALTQLADVLADNGIALGVVLGRVVDGAASIVDALVPACASSDPGDAGWTSAGDLANGRLRLTEDMARRRGIALRRDLDSITAP